MQAQRAATLPVVLLAGLLASCVGAAGSPVPTVPAASPTSSPTPAVLSTPSPVVSPSPALETYVVASGDTFSQIAAHFGVSVEALLALNPSIEDPNRIAVGDVISVPARSVGTVIRIEGPDYVTCASGRTSTSSPSATRFSRVRTSIGSSLRLHRSPRPGRRGRCRGGPRGRRGSTWTGGPCQSWPSTSTPTMWATSRGGTSGGPTGA